MQKTVERSSSIIYGIVVIALSQINVWVDLAGLSLTTPPKVGTTLLVLDGPGVGQSRQIVSVGPGNASIVLDSALDDWVIPASSTGSHEDLVAAEASKVAVVSSFGSKIFAGNLFNCECILPARSERSSSGWQYHFPKPSSCFLGLCCRDRSSAVVCARCGGYDHLACCVFTAFMNGPLNAADATVVCVGVCDCPFLTKVRQHHSWGDGRQQLPRLQRAAWRKHQPRGNGGCR